MRITRAMINTRGTNSNAKSEKIHTCSGDTNPSPDVRICTWICTIFSSFNSKTISQVKSNCDIQFGAGFFLQITFFSLIHTYIFFLTSCELHKIHYYYVFNVRALRMFLAHWKSQIFEQIIQKCNKREMSMVICSKYEITSNSVLKFMFITINILDTQFGTNWAQSY